MRSVAEIKEEHRQLIILLSPAGDPVLSGESGGSLRERVLRAAQQAGRSGSPNVQEKK